MQKVSSAVLKRTRYTGNWFLLGALFIVGLLPLAASAQKGTAERGTRAVINSPQASTTVVINEVYGGAGCGTAGCSTYGNDFIELKNISANPVNITGWSVQYKSAGGNTGTYVATPLSGIIQPGDTYLVAEAGNANGVTPIPAPNATGTISMSATAGKVALVNTTTPLDATTCPPTAAGSVLIDLVGYGTGLSCQEGAAGAPATTTTTSAARNTAGTDTDNNAADFTAAAPTPKAATTPTAAGVTVSGRVLSADGRGIRNALVSISGDGIGTVNAQTGRYGEFEFTDVPAGHTYTVTVAARRFSFDQATQVINLQDNVSDLNFIGSGDRR